MRPQQQNRRMRGRGGNNNNRKGPNPLTRSYESNGPDVKIRGTAQQVADKYSTLARDAQSSGDRVIAENYLQHAEHYNRVIAAAQAAQQQQQQQNARDNRDDDDDDGEDRDYSDSSNANANAAQNGTSQDGNRQQRKVNDGSGPQPSFDTPPAELGLNQSEERPKRETKSANGRHSDQVHGASSEKAEASSDTAEASSANGAVESEGEPAPKRARRPRRTARSRASEGTDGEGEGSDSTPEAATQS